MLCVSLISLRGVCRFLLFSSELPFWSQLRLVYFILANVSAASADALYYTLPLKLSETWFPAAERTLAWSVLEMAPHLGAGATSIIIPWLIRGLEDVYLLAHINAIATLISCLLVLICVTRSEPKYPPSERLSKSTEASKVSLIQGVKLLVTNKSVSLLTLAVCCLDGAYLVINFFIADILEALGHHKMLAGCYLAIACLGGGFAQIVLSFVFPDSDSDSDLNLGSKQKSQMINDTHTSKCFTTNIDGSDNDSAKQPVVTTYSVRCKSIVTMTTSSLCLLALTLSINKMPVLWPLILFAGSLFIFAVQLLFVQFKNVTMSLISGQVSESTFAAIEILLSMAFYNIYSLVFLLSRSNMAAAMLGISTIPIAFTVCFLIFLKPKQKPKLSSSSATTMVDNCIKADKSYQQQAA